MQQTLDVRSHFRSRRCEPDVGKDVGEFYQNSDYLAAPARTIAFDTDSKFQAFGDWPPPHIHFALHIGYVQNALDVSLLDHPTRSGAARGSKAGHAVPPSPPATRGS